MSLRKLTAGDGYSYLTRQVAAHDTTEKGHRGLADYYDEQGESPGRWMGAGLQSLGLASGEPVASSQMASLFGQGHHPRATEIEAALAAAGGTRTEVAKAVALGREFAVHAAASGFNVRVAEAFTAYNLDHGQTWNAPIHPDERARIRTEIGATMFAAQHGRPPQDARELSGFIATASRQATSAVAGFDLSFSPVKSVSALWALAPRDVAGQVRAAHEAAVADTLAWLEREVAHTRVGRAGARQVEVRGLVAAVFTHRDSRAGDPDLHTHVAVSNKVQALDGRWLALDGRVLYAAKVAASEHYNTRIEAELINRLGVEFTERAEVGSTKLPVREIRGVSTTLTRFWSRRRADITRRQGELASDFQRTFGRPPTAVEALWQAERATLETRGAKHEPRSEREQRAAWRSEAVTVLGHPADVDEMHARAVQGHPTGQTPTRRWVEDTAAATVEAVESTRATWNVWHLLAEAQRQARRAGITLQDVDRAVDQVVDTAVSRCVRLGVDDPVPEPPQLRRSNGASVYDVHGAALYTSATVLSAEQELLALAARGDGPALSDVRVEVALAASAATGFELNDAQSAMVRDLATSRAVVQLALAPAGTGKTTTMSVLADAWTQSGGRVIGLAPSAQAAHELGQAVTGHTDTLAKLSWTLAHEPSAAWPRWIREIGPSSLVIIDEAGQAGTTELTAAVRYVATRGGAVRLIGDDQQLAAVGAGGVLRDLQLQHGAVALSEVRRFDDPAEAAATLAVREGDAGALGFYADHGRIHVGDLSTATDQAYDAWAADRAAGLDAVLLGPTRDLVGQLNARARADRIARAPLDGGLSVGLADGNRASRGDVILTRRNNRRLVISRSNWVKNGDRWVVEQVHTDGSLEARHRALGRSIRLPVDYVAEHVQLGYATTVHGAQGMTADTAHLVATGEEARQTLYVGLSRGRRANHVYLAAGMDGDPHSLIDPRALRPPTAIDVLTDVLERDGSDRSATTTQREASSSAPQLHNAALRYHDALGCAAEDVIGVDALSRVELDLDAIWPGLAAEPAYPTLRAHLALRALDGSDPVAALLDAAGTRELGTSEDRAAVLDWRLGAPASTGPLPWLDPIPALLADHARWGPYLHHRAARVSRLAAAVRTATRGWSPTATPRWATDLTGKAHDDLRADLAVWRAAFAVPETDMRPSGPAQSGTLTTLRQRDLDGRFASVSRPHCADSGLIDRLPVEVRTDAGFALLSTRLGALQAAGVGVQTLLDQALGIERPLPDERTADALWWRIVSHLGPAALRESGSRMHGLHADWTSHLTDRLGDRVGERVMADPMWPALVAAVGARPAEWTPEQLLDSALSGRGPHVPPDRLCSTLVWRIATMTDEPFDEPETDEPEFVVPTPLPAEAPTFTGGSPAARIRALNEWALEHFAAMYSRSWAPDYLRDRLGADLASDARFHPGYAPPGPASLIRHLRARGASTDELLNAGLARVDQRGRLVDTFRDRLVFPIYGDAGIVGFVGRRNPTKREDEYAGPKYLNTRQTSLFTKGEQLFGVEEGRADLAKGATPVLVEGPLDACAVTLATAGDYVGIAPLGTAFTEAQATKLKPYLVDAPGRIIIATDPDPAGWQSAQRAFWRLTALRACPGHLRLPDGVDPAGLLHAEGALALKERLTLSAGFAESLMERVLDERLAVYDDVFSRVDLCRELARIVGSLPPERWPDAAEMLAERLDLSREIVQQEIFEAGSEWTDRPGACVTRELAALRFGPPATSLPARSRTAPSAPGLRAASAPASAPGPTPSTRR